MKTKNVCAHCGATLSISTTVPSKKLGIPFVKCGKCGEFNTTQNLREYYIVNPSNSASYFFGVEVFLLSLIIPAIVAAILYFTLDKMFALCAIPLIPIIAIIVLQVKKQNNIPEIAKSKRRCGYKGYLDFLSANGFKIDAKRKAKACEQIEYSDACDIFGALIQSDKFLSHFPTAFALKCRETQSKEILTEMKNEIKSSYEDNKTTDNTPVQNIEVPEIENSDIGSIEKYIKTVLKKYNFKCSEGRFQNIKIDVITYLEDHDEPEKNAIKTVIFNALKEH